ncbi:MAG: efflux RND transporter permease subunit, partial [Alphaproteobacteria bacterium]
MISKFFIERPVLANVLAILMVVIGAVALMRLAVAQYPNVVPPTISVTTRYPGASARAVVDTVALPIEQQHALPRCERARGGRHRRAANRAA